MVCMGNVHAGLKCPIVSLEIYSYCEDVCCDYFYFNIIFSLLFFYPPFLFFPWSNRDREGFLAD